ncbi:MAG: TIGR01212 family radical SAM protein [Epsilonproteobacteria bacterium]|nr:TIGR01212 family radical SAM protein [Campylobacterota bacterium]
MKKIRTFGKYLKEKYGFRVKKIPLAIGGFTCPNIDGSVAKGGCTFCLNDSFSPNLAKNKDKIFLNLNSKENPILNKQIAQVILQIKQNKLQFQKKLKIKKYIAYFQAFTNTYAPFDTLKTLYETALNQKDIIGISIGTRSDSVEDEVLEYLSELSKTKEVWIEFGIQSTFDETLKRINRGHDVKSIKDAIKRAKRYNLNVCGHLIFGLPGENKEMMLKSAYESYEMGIDSVKFHPLYVVKNTILANEYLRGEFKPISMQEYIDVLVEAIDMMPKEIIIQRVTAGIKDSSLLAPSWCGEDKNYQMAQIKKALRRRGYVY